MRAIDYCRNVRYIISFAESVANLYLLLFFHAFNSTVCNAVFDWLFVYLISTNLRAQSFAAWRFWLHSHINPKQLI
ncbi:uncharacterized protein PHALS_14772 [Plasmopara halstedii]|uniref:Uncharacterized protein n=1 Tax=Plasmopara halstedii TaxID=4781 RepID=A0A0P1AS20_PLAHL|nr:uncharacterized protein PHALS_14772 [Plasmopara halstedii]CEG44085.1 hypothetical protein PHALS_14772 [Plasmopara halstedii]|eukprot:XP_024580454.1 hypothetical protein PHALS_14772 [Plasmopara halstedii]